MQSGKKIICAVILACTVVGFCLVTQFFVNNNANVAGHAAEDHLLEKKVGPKATTTDKPTSQSLNVGGGGESNSPDRQENAHAVGVSRSARPSTPIQVWERVATDCQISRPDTFNVSRIMRDYFSKADHSFSADLLAAVEGSLKQVLQQFGGKFYRPSEREGFTRLMAWLISEAIKPDEDRAADLTRSREQFTDFLKHFGQVVQEDLQKHLGGEYPRYSALIQGEISQVKARALEIFLRLQQDPLYPSCKKPLSEDCFLEYQRVLGTRTYLRNIREPEQMMRLKEEERPLQIKFALASFPYSLIFEITGKDIANQIETNLLFDGMSVAWATPKGSYWPVDIQITRSKSK